MSRCASLCAACGTREKRVECAEGERGCGRSVSVDAGASTLYVDNGTDAADPMEKFCVEDPAADECRVYED